MNVVIAGGGPAGLITALNLIRRGIKPLVLEKNKEIRSKACGEALGLNWLDEVPFDSTPYISKKVSGAKLIFSGGNFDHLKEKCAVLDRDRWLGGMAEEIKLKGGEIKLNSEVIAAEGNSAVSYTHLRAHET